MGRLEDARKETDIRKAVAGSDLIVILTDHNEFKEMDWNTLENMNHKRIFDTKNTVKNPPEGFEYINLGTLHQFLPKKKEHFKPLQSLSDKWSGFLARGNSASTR